ncbi:MAG: biotin-dependent carboxyltransferase family protein [Verrucomicrobiota bacterium]
MPLEILSTGSGIALQDGGRRGWLRYGVPAGGAMDRHAMHAANRLLGNKADAPVVEVLMQGARFRATDDLWVALAGADSCSLVAAWSAKKVRLGEVLEFSKKAVGLFAYLAVPGGFQAEHWFGSVSADPRNGLGKIIRKGDIVEPSARQPGLSTGGIGRRLLIEEERRKYLSKEYFSLLPGPQFELFSAQAREALVVSEWMVSPKSDRTGYRLQGPSISVPDSIPSEPVLPGSFQVPGNGKPIITMVDGPTVGGYPKIAVLKDVDRDRLAQCAPGTQLFFKWADS